MTTLQTLPINKSFLSNNKFEFVLRRIPNFTFLVQSISLPSVGLQSSSVNTPYATISVPGNQMTYSPLNVTFIMDEDMKSWIEIFWWMYQLGNPVSFNKRGNLRDNAIGIDAVVADATRQIKTNSNNPNLKINFYGLYPTDLGEIQFTSTEGQEFQTCSVTFNYTYYELEGIEQLGETVTR